MVQSHQRRRLGQPVALDQRKPQGVPEALQLRRKRGSATDDRPELQPQCPMDPAKTPPVPPGRLAPSGLNFAGQLWIFPQQMRPQELQHPGYGRQHRDPLPPDRRHQPRRLQLRLEMHLGRQQGRHPKAHKLPKHMAQRKTMQKSQRVHPPLIAQVFRDLPLDRLHAGENVAMRMDHALRLRGRSRSEDDLQRRLLRDRRIHRERRRHGQGSRERRECQRRRAGRKFVQQRPIAHNQAWRDLSGHPHGKIGGTRRVQRHRDRSPQQTAEEGRNPLRRVLAPQHHPLADANASPRQFGREPPSQRREFGIRGRVSPVAAVHHHRRLRAMAAKILNETGQMRTHALKCSQPRVALSRRGFREDFPGPTDVDMPQGPQDAPMGGIQVAIRSSCRRAEADS